MTGLHRRELTGYDARWPAIEAAGGLWVAGPDTDSVQLRRAVVSGQVRALESHLRDIGALAGLPLEYLFIATPNVDAAHVNTLTGLRGLSLDSWAGDLRVDEMADLEWFGVVEVGKGQLDTLWANGHSDLRWLSVGKYRERDLQALSRLPRLADLAIVDSRSLVSLGGIEELQQLQRLELAMCSALEDVAGIEDATAVRSVVLESCNRVDDLSPLAELPELRVVQIEMRTPPSLRSLAGHPTLEFVWLIGGKPRADEVDALLESPSLRMINARRESWLRTGGTWVHAANIYAMTPEQIKLYEELLEEMNRLKYGA